MTFRLPGPLCAWVLGADFVDEGTLALTRMSGPAQALTGAVGTRLPPAPRDRVEIVLDAAGLAALHPPFGTVRPGWTQRVTVVYTLGRSTRDWTEAKLDKPGVHGFSYGSVRENAKHLDSTIVIDLAAHAGLAIAMSASSLRRPGGVSRERRTYAEARKELFTTFAHELLHTLQQWIYGQDWGRMYAEADRDGQRYQGNRYEQAAERFGADWVRDHKAELERGDYDARFPAATLAGLCRR